MESRRHDYLQLLTSDGCDDAYGGPLFVRAPWGRGPRTSRASGRLGRKTARRRIGAYVTDQWPQLEPTLLCLGKRKQQVLHCYLLDLKGDVPKCAKTILSLLRRSLSGVKEEAPQNTHQFLFFDCFDYSGFFLPNWCALTTESNSTTSCVIIISTGAIAILLR
jgi:hypothetical protein